MKARYFILLKEMSLESQGKQQERVDKMVITSLKITYEILLNSKHLSLFQLLNRAVHKHQQLFNT